MATRLGVLQRGHSTVPLLEKAIIIHNVAPQLQFTCTSVLHCHLSHSRKSPCPRAHEVEAGKDDGTLGAFMMQGDAGLEALQLGSAQDGTPVLDEAAWAVAREFLQRRQRQIVR